MWPSGFGIEKHRTLQRKPTPKELFLKRSEESEAVLGAVRHGEFGSRSETLSCRDPNKSARCSTVQNEHIHTASELLTESLSRVGLYKKQEHLPILSFTVYFKSTFKRRHSERPFLIEY